MTDHSQTIARAAALITEMVMELHFRGCEDTHPLIKRAGELVPMLEAVGNGTHPDKEENGRTDSTPPQTLQSMAAETVSAMDLETMLDRGEVTGTELAEAAFTFENELMALLGDDNTMPMEAYSGMDESGLIKVIGAAVDNICRLRSS
ncbi:MAG: hypothetical protein HUN04_21905 [Desulfobacter sp.]|nr:MAG: hypothetical protein HUN04_21905 [Desulfobacter sp.]